MIVPITSLPTTVRSNISKLNLKSLKEIHVYKLERIIEVMIIGIDFNERGVCKISTYSMEEM